VRGAAQTGPGRGASGTSTKISLPAIALALVTGCGAQANLQAQPHQAVTVRVTATKTVIRYRHHHHHPVPGATPSASPAPPAPALGCKVLATGSGGEEFNVTTVGGGTYTGTISVSFYGPSGSGQVFPPTTVQGASPVGMWYPVPSADIGASAAPVGCTASAG
jgi:hypothetical protein